MAFVSSFTPQGLRKSANNLAVTRKSSAAWSPARAPAMQVQQTQPAQPTQPVQVPNPAQRQDRSKLIRIKAAELAFDRGVDTQVSNGEEDQFDNLIGSFTKGLPHDTTTGLVKSRADFDLFVRSIDTGLPADQRNVPLGPASGGFGSGIALQDPPVGVRGWESSGAGLTFDLEGPDAQAIAMPPAPTLSSDELLTEMTEVYCQALLREVPFIEYDSSSKLQEHIGYINATNPQQLGPRARGPFTPQTVFRGITRGDDVGPYLSQFLIVGTEGLGQINAMADGIIQYGSMSMDQRVRFATPGLDYMTTWGAWIDVQQAANVRGRDSYVDNPGFRFIANGRDLATWVHFDALYQAYLNACIILLNLGAPFDNGIPFQEPDSIDRQEGFAHWGPAHILSLVTEVATRVLKGVRFQKFNLHRRLRPEAVGGRLDRWLNAGDPAVQAIKSLADRMSPQLLANVAAHNKIQNKNPDRANDDTNGHSQSFLLPMAFPEGSPMHPSYGAGHATVAGGCVTMLKAFFDTDYKLDFAYQPAADGSCLVDCPGIAGTLTVEGELNKLASNISIGRNWGGVHYFTDYFESVILGESMAIGILEEQAHTYNEDFSMTIPKFDGSIAKIVKTGTEVCRIENGQTKCRRF